MFLVISQSGPEMVKSRCICCWSRFCTGMFDEPLASNLLYGHAKCMVIKYHTEGSGMEACHSATENLLPNENKKWLRVRSVSKPHCLMGDS